ncbi:hypothetical protein SLUN_04775 [Streptomyces lunaelactis]|uniref:WXG100 family type VII secretion target n=1 Tax=Streptomyces lunaelactis TaxID=1535768 RepID=A0A2R4SXK4_9ACTN|nr:WXG100 family type VII secretion target [Streptomyces lunaelactis]AVZ71605.1 hypothetical protein SLUN_04775 [Streptomyces lunaelactis]NUK89215.1 WXG100 family type VII secretion target [Streptomyces lunaelactis]NUL07436.1 WXG100 family type VII secretion target [Streptomyces lunaelactis]
MPDNDFSVDTDLLGRSAPHVQALAGSIRSIGATLQGRLDSLGECWGDDEGGRQFLEQYAEPSRQITRGIADTGEVLDSTVDGIWTMAKGFERTEEQSAEVAHVINTAVQSSDTGTPRPSRR